jgi:signal transduction histidine kinase/CHASE1-domain containing sensor protein
MRLAMREITDRIKALTSLRRALWTGALFSVAVGALFYFLTARSVESDARQRFANQALIAKNHLTFLIKSYNDLLRGAASMFHANTSISRFAFRDYVNNLHLPQQFPAVEVINYAEYVLDKDREKIEERLRREYGPDIGKGKPSIIMPPGRRPSYSVLTVAQPGSWLDTIGIDVGGRPEVRPTVLKMIDTGDFVHSGIPIEAITGPNRVGLGIRLPIYRAGIPANTPQERRVAYIGSMGIAVSVPKLVQDVLKEMHIKNVRMTLVDVTRGPQALMLPELDGGRVLFDSLGTDRVPAPPLNPDTGEYLNESGSTNFQGRLWKVIFSTRKADFYTGFDAYFPWLAMVFGTISASLLYALFHTLSSSRQRALGMAEEMTSELRDSEAELKRSHDHLRRLAAHAEQIKEMERKRIAREIHDDLGQNLLALRIEAEMLSSRTAVSHPRLHQRASWTLSQIDATIKSVRQIINDLRPNVLDLGLAAAVEWQIAEFRRRTGIECTLTGDNLDRANVNDEWATAFFRILQESLNNVARHAMATAVCVELKLQTREPYHLSMTVADNGVGMPANGPRPWSFGLVGIEERVRLLHGTFLIDSTPGAGTILSVSAPLHIAHPPDAMESASSTAQVQPVV